MSSSGGARPQGGTSAGGSGPAGGSASGRGGTHFVIDAKRDIIDTALTFDLKTQLGSATVLLAPAETPGATFEDGVGVRSVSLNGTPLPFQFRLIEHKVDVDVPASTDPLAIVLEFSFPLNGEFGASSSGYTLTWPQGCGYLFPCHSDPSDGTTFQLSLLNVPKNSVAIYADEIKAEAPSYMLGWAIGAYTKLDLGLTNAGTKVATWYLPGGQDAALAGTAHLLQAFDWFEQHFGAYRFGGEVGSVQVNWGSSSYGGMEHHPRWHVDSSRMGSEITHAHEAAHGWFGNGVRLRCWEDLVLSEGLAAYLSARALEEVGASAAAAAFWTSYEEDLEKLRAAGDSRVAWPQTCGEVDVLRSGLFSHSLYVKGALFFRSLEQRVGRPAFDVALRTFYERFGGRVASVPDLLNVVQEVSMYDSSECAAAWLVRGSPIPALVPCPL